MAVTAAGAKQCTQARVDAPKKWQKAYARRLFVSDLLVVAAVAFGAEQIRFGSSANDLVLKPFDDSQFALSYGAVSLILVASWMLGLHVFNTRDYRRIGTGPLEYKLVTDTTIKVFGLLAIFALALRAPIARGYVLLAFPAGLFGLLFTRWLWRKWLRRVRMQGRFLHRAVIAGENVKTNHVAQQILQDAAAGFQLVGAVLDRGILEGPEPLVTSNSYAKMIEIVDATGADTLIVTSADAFSPSILRQLGWALEEREVDFIVAPALTDIAGPRIHMRPVAGLPLIHVEYPEFTGQKLWLKRLFDIFVTSCLILILSPVLIAVACAVKLTSKGPLLYRQERIGQNGEPFKMLKFRSMIPNADAQLAELLAAQGTSDKPLFKIADDPRITPIGKFIRRFSLDELPQLFNVLGGSMSLVGPRPQVAAEVALYDRSAHRRLLVKPGITGLWQVSGRSNLEWDDAIRLDLYYVENWSLTGDFVILYRTIRAVFASDGAY